MLTIAQFLRFSLSLPPLFLSGKFELQQQSEIARDDMFNVIDSSLIFIRRM